MATFPVSLNLTAGVVKQSAGVNVPAGSVLAVLVLDATWLTDPTALISWGVERSVDGVSWLPFAAGSRPGGNPPDKEGNTHPNVDISVSLGAIQGQKIRGTIGYTLGNTGLPASATASGTLTLT